MKIEQNKDNSVTLNVTQEEYNIVLNALAELYDKISIAMTPVDYKNIIHGMLYDMNYYKKED